MCHVLAGFSLKRESLTFFEVDLVLQQDWSIEILLLCFCPVSELCCLSIGCISHWLLLLKTNKSEAPFNTEAYANYKALVDKEREQIDASNLTEYIYQLGYKIDTMLSKIISQLDVILDEDFDPNKVTCSVDNKEVDCDTWEDK